MAVNSRARLPDLGSSAAETLARVVALPQVRSALGWLRTQEPQIAQWQLELSRIPAPPFGEAARGEWLSARFRDLGLEDIAIDEVGNVLGLRPGVGGQCVSISAHIDTVFPAGTPLNVRQMGSRLYGPGVSDNGAGVAALLAVAGAMHVCQIPHALPIVFIGNVGEEGEGDLRGMRHLFTASPLRDAILYSLILDGAGSDTIVSEALGSRRFEVIVRGPGGHSWSDFGAPNPILVLAHAMNAFAQTPVPSSPKTVFNIGVVRGGTSVNSIPESASMRVDIRSTSMAEMERLEDALRLSLERAIHAELQVQEKRNPGSRRTPGLSSEVVPIGNRPAGELHPSAHILQVIAAVDSHLGNAAQIHRASTDANVPLSLGREAVAIGGGGSGGGAHTLQEWFDCSGRELGLRRILLALLTLAGVG